MLAARCRAVVDLPGLVIAPILCGTLLADRIWKAVSVFFVDAARSGPSNATKFRRVLRRIKF